MSTRRLRHPVALLGALALIFSVVPITVPPAYAGTPTDCFAVADAGPNSSADYLVRVDRLTGGTTGIADISGSGGKIEAAAIEPGGNRLFATDAAQFGEINMTTGAFTTIGSGVGDGHNDVDSLMFDPFTGVLWAADRNGTDDTLFRIDTTTGLAIVGSSVTILSTVVTGLDDIDDLAISPYDGTMYAINNNSTKDKLVTINRTTGAVAVVIDIEVDYPQAQDMEGLTFTNDGIMYGSDGDGAPNGDMWLLDPVLGTVTFFTDLAPNVGGDFESIGCLTADLNTISGTVFFDANSDALLDSGDTGESTVTVRLYRDINSDGLVDGGDALVDTTDTAGDGTYSFTVAAVGDFVLDIDTADLPANFYMTTDNVEVANFAATDFGVTDSGNDFGYALPVIIADFVWDDLNADGIQDTGEPGLPGVTVNLLDGLGTPLGPTTTTAADGSYVFGNLGAGTFSVEFVAPAGWLRSPANQGGDDTIDSDADATGKTPSVTLGAGEADLTIDAGFWNPGSIGDLVWQDLNGDGAQDAGEPGIGGVTVDLLDGGGSPITSTVTAADGSYSFTGLVAGSYQVDPDQSTVPAGFVLTTGNDPDSITLAAGETNLTADFGYYDPASAGIDIQKGPDPQTILPGETANWTITVTNTGSVDLTNVAVTDALAADCDNTIGNLAAGANTAYNCSLTGVTADFTNTALVSGDDPLGNTVNDSDTAFVSTDSNSAVIGDIVWEDLNGDGLQDAGEPGIGGATVDLLDGGGSPITSTVTAGDGSYQFTGLAAGSYQVDPDQTTVPAGFVLTTGNDPDSITLTSGETNLTADFGYYDPASAGINIQKTPDDQSIASGGTAIFTITVTNTGTVDLSNVTVTDALVVNCDNRIGNLAAGASTVYNCSLAGVTADFTNTALVTGDDPLGNTVNDSDNANVAIETNSARIGDTVFYDANSDGAQGPGDPGLEGVTVRLLDNTATEIATTTTGADGSYQFTGLASGDYSVAIDLPSGTALTTANNPWPVTLSVGATYVDADFGLIGTGTIGQVIWLDSNESGTIDGSEKGTQGVSITAVWAGMDGTLGTGDDLSFSAVTDSSGAYAITGLPAGQYQVSVDGSTLPSGYELTYTPDGDNNLIDTLTLGAGETVNDENFGYVVAEILPVTGADFDRMLGLAIALMALGSGVAFVGGTVRMRPEGAS